MRFVNQRVPFVVACLVAVAASRNARAADEIILKSPPEKILRQVLEGSPDGKTVTIETPPEGWTIQLTRPLAIKSVKDFTLISRPGPTYLQGDQLSYERCKNIRHENFAHRHHGGDDFATIARSIVRSNGMDGRGLVITDCQDLTVARCSFALCADDMAGVGGLESERIRFKQCLFSMPVGVYGQGLLVTTNSPGILHVDDLVKIDRCVFSGVTYRTPKLEGGFCLITQCVIAGNLYPIELKEPDAVFAGCLFAPDARMGRRPIVYTSRPQHVRRLGLFGNLYRGSDPTGRQIEDIPADQWATLVGNVRGVFDKQNTLPRAGEAMIDQWRLKMTPQLAGKVINDAGPTVIDEIDQFARRYALWQCGLETSLTPFGR